MKCLTNFKNCKKKNAFAKIKKSDKKYLKKKKNHLSNDS